MPAESDEVEEALIEGINIEFLTAPVRMIALEGRVKGLECVRTELHQVPDSERPSGVWSIMFVIVVISADISAPTSL